ncbi:MAG: hypothetical protein GY841_18565 [FCB group bacterium]|nr:hypothetical protein [FCB group bacterium]
MELFYYVAAVLPNGKIPGLKKAMCDRFFLQFSDAEKYVELFDMPNLGIFRATADVGETGEDMQVFCEIED